MGFSPLADYDKGIIIWLKAKILHRKRHLYLFSVGMEKVQGSRFQVQGFYVES